MAAKKILVVDDDRDLVASMEAFLGARGFDVATAHNGREAYERIIEKRPDLIVLDVMMDYDEEGMVLARALKSTGPRDIPIIMVSGFTRRRHEKRSYLRLMGQDWPVETFFQKPVRWRLWLSGSTFCSPVTRSGRTWPVAGG